MTDADELMDILNRLDWLFDIWELETGRNVHVDLHGNRFGYADDYGTIPLPTSPTHYDPEFLAFLREHGKREAQELADGKPPRWRRGKCYCGEPEVWFEGGERLCGLHILEAA